MLRKARVEDVPQIRQLINIYAQKEIMLPRAIGEIYENIRDFYVIEHDGKIIACGALHVTWEYFGEILSLAVTPDELRRGHGTKIFEACMKEAYELGLKHVVTLTYATDFFSLHGFKIVDKSSLPHKLWSMCIKCTRFPDCDEIAMMKDI